MPKLKPTKKEREMYRQYVTDVTEAGLNPRSLDEWSTYRRFVQARKAKQRGVPANA